MSSKTPKEQALQKLVDASGAYDEAIKSCKVSEDFAGLPNAFPVSAKHLPILQEAVQSMEKCLRNGTETQEDEKKYGAVGEFAEMCREQAEYLGTVFTEVAKVNDVSSKRVRYHEVVKKSKGQNSIETVVQNMFKQTVSVLQAVELLVENDLIGRLQNAQKEVDSLESSLVNNPRWGTTVNNNSTGSQYNHLGHGHQNINDKGIQINGDYSTNHLPPNNHN